jgi:Arc/MetJ family transcription regulator
LTCLSTNATFNMHKILSWRCAMRATVTLDKGTLDDLVAETQTKNKAAAVRKAVAEYLRRKKIERIKSMKGKMEFDLTADQLRHYER